MGEDTTFENGQICDFQGLVTRDLDLHLGSGHTAYRHASLSDLYLRTTFHRNRRNVLWTDGRTDADKHFTHTLLGRLVGVSCAGILWFKFVKIKGAKITSH